MLVVSFVAARRALEDAAARSARGGAGAPRPRLQPARARAGADRRRRRSRSCSSSLVFAAALVGTTDPFANLAPTWVYVVFWLGVPFLSLLFGNVWRALSPWRAIADAFVWVWERTRPRGAPARGLPGAPRPLPGRGRAVRLRRARALLLRTRRTRGRSRSRSRSTRTSRCSGCRVRARRPGCERGEGFAILFAYIARMAPLVAPRQAGSGCGCRSPALREPSRSPGSVAVPRGRARLGRVRRLQPDDHLAGPDRASRGARTSSTGRARASCSSRASTWPGSSRRSRSSLLAFLGACAVARWMVNAPRSLAPEFVLSLVPIALVYAVAHYFSLFVIQGQFVVPLLSDPFGKGWDLFGTAGVTPNLAVLRPNTIWYVQAAALVLGHVAGLARRPRPRRRDLPRPRGCAPQPVRDARADGGLHGRRPLAALAP